MGRCSQAMFSTSSTPQAGRDALYITGFGDIFVMFLSLACLSLVC